MFGLSFRVQFLHLFPLAFSLYLVFHSSVGAVTGFVKFEVTEFKIQSSGTINNEIFLYIFPAEFQQCQIDRMEMKLRRSNLIFNIDTTVLGREMKGRHIESAGEVLYIYRCAKMEVTIVIKTFFSKKVPVRLTPANETVIKNNNPIARIFHSNHNAA